MYIDIASAMPTNCPCLPVSMPYSCATCDRSFISLQGIQSHCKAKQHRQNPECRQCNRTFVNDHALQQHQQHSPNHPKISINSHKPYHCTECKRPFGNQSALSAHSRDFHHRCDVCSMSFASKKALNRHYKTSSAHRSQRAKCPFCPTYFVSPSAVAQHIESGRHGITRHQVTHAVKCLDIVPSICIAQRIEGKSPTPPTTVEYYVPLPSAFDGRAYACFLCQRMFRSLRSLSDHLNSPVHDANEFKCPKCEKRFKLVSGLTQHIESAACGLAKLPQIQDLFQGLTARFSRLVSM